MTITELLPPLRTLHFRASSPEALLEAMARLSIWTDAERTRLIAPGSLGFLELGDLLVNVIDPASERGVNLEPYTEKLLEYFMEKRPPEMREMSVEEVLTAYIELSQDGDDFVAVIEGLKPLVIEDRIGAECEVRLTARREEASELLHARADARRRVIGIQRETNQLIGAFNETYATALDFDEKRKEVAKETSALAALADKVL